jgi:thiol-disulfide isomerase/thioredoxin
MKKILVALCAALLIIAFIDAREAEKVAKNRKDVLKEIYQTYGRGEYDKALELLDKALKRFGSTTKLQQLKYNILMKQKKYGEALTFIDGEIKKSGESEALLSARYNILFAQDNLPEALRTALKKDKIAKTKSPWDCMNIMHVYLRQGSKTDALDWLQEAVRRGFTSYRLLSHKKYELLKHEKRFYELIESMKMSIGLGYPAKNFSTTLLSGEEFELRHHRGKVVMAVFWASWCEPCLAELPFLHEYYKQFKDKGFEVIAISLDSSQKRAGDYIRQYNLEWKNACSGKVWQDGVVKRLGINNIPSYRLIDRKGVLRAADLKGEELRSAIAQLLEEGKKL